MPILLKLFSSQRYYLLYWGKFQANLPIEWSSDPLDHIYLSRDWVNLYAHNDVVSYGAFSMTLARKARVLYKTLKLEIIGNFSKFAR